MLTMFAMMLADFDIEYFHDSASEWVLVFLFVVFMLLTSIILLNLLIAIMTNKYEEIKETEELNFYIGRGKFIRDIELKLISYIIDRIK